MPNTTYRKTNANGNAEMKTEVSTEEKVNACVRWRTPNHEYIYNRENLDEAFEEILKQLL